MSQPLPKPQVTSERPNLGLVCITTSPEVRFKTMTRKRLLQLDEAAQTEALRSLYAENLRRLNLAITFCQTYQIRLYRLISNLLPFSDTPLGDRILTEFAADLRQVGDRAQAAGIRLVLHPDQFVVLNSDKPTVIENSITILSAQARWFDLMGLPQSPWAAINIHGGKGDRAERLVQVIGELPGSVRDRLTLENDEHTYSTTALLEICQAAQVPLVFDAHHHVVHERLDSYDHPSVGHMLAAARTTWPEPDWQLVHISNGREALHDPRHSDLIATMPESYRQVAWIEVEAKQKEVAIAQLRQTWLQAAA